MTHPNLTVVAILATFQAVCGWLFVFRTDMLVRWGRNNYAKSKLIRSSPNAALVMKPWYPVLLRGAGVFIWLFDVGFLALAILATMRH
jgi:hypothetical protein